MTCSEIFLRNLLTPLIYASLKDAFFTVSESISTVPQRCGSQSGGNDAHGGSVRTYEDVFIEVEGTCCQREDSPRTEYASLAPASPAECDPVCRDCHSEQHRASVCTLLLSRTSVRKELAGVGKGFSAIHDMYARYGRCIVKRLRNRSRLSPC